MEPQDLPWNISVFLQLPFDSNYLEATISTFSAVCLVYLHLSNLHAENLISQLSNLILPADILLGVMKPSLTWCSSTSIYFSSGSSHTITFKKNSLSAVHFMTVNIAHSCTPCYTRFTFLSLYNFLLSLEETTALFVCLVFYIYNY